MKLIIFGIEKDKNLIVQFPVFIQPYMQQPLMLYQTETVPVPIMDQNEQAHSYSHLQIRQQELRTCMRVGYNFAAKSSVWRTQIQILL